MKTSCFFLFLAAVIIAGCQPKIETKSPDLNAAKTEVASLMEKFQNAFSTKDTNSIGALFADDGLFCGTDPSELLDKKAILKMMNQTLADTSVQWKYSADKREIRVAQDGTSAIVLEQFTMPALAPKIPMRLIYHAVKSGDAWTFDFVSWNFITLNEDIPKLNKALE
jgi:uncharacterized protein (TIGR02246 family)